MCTNYLTHLVHSIHHPTHPGFIAALVIYVHYQFLCDHWQIWTYQLKYWYRAAFVAQLLFATIVAMLIVVGIYLKQRKHLVYYAMCIEHVQINCCR